MAKDKEIYYKNKIESLKGLLEIDTQYIKDLEGELNELIKTLVKGVNLPLPQMAALKADIKAKKTAIKRAKITRDRRIETLNQHKVYYYETFNF